MTTTTKTTNTDPASRLGPAWVACETAGRMPFMLASEEERAIRASAIAAAEEEIGNVVADVVTILGNPEGSTPASIRGWFKRRGIDVPAPYLLRWARLSSRVEVWPVKGPSRYRVKLAR